jgi:Importin 13 repeat
VGAHGRSLMHALLCGFAATAPRSVAPNLIELLSTLLLRCPMESRSWMSDILYAVSCLLPPLLFVQRDKNYY